MNLTEGPYILWICFGCEGWHPESFSTLKEALEADKHHSTWVITKKVEYVVDELAGNQ